MRTEIKDALQHLHQLWRQEQRSTHAQFLAERKRMTLDERVAQGLALRDLEVEDTGFAPGHRTLLWLRVPDRDALEDLRLSAGAPVRLWWDSPDSPDAVLATVARRASDKLAVMIDGEPPERIEFGAFHLDRDEPQHTFERGRRALDASLAAEGPQARLRDVLFGATPPDFDRPEPLSFFDTDLNGPQREAVALALRAREVALIHGPPGTGKTRTLVEVIAQATARGLRVLAAAASNTAVDNLAERLVAAGLEPVRLGHPARVSTAMEAHTLDALLDRSGVYKMTRQWHQEAAVLRRRAARASTSRDERRALYKEASSLTRDAHSAIEREQIRILGRARVICATAAGSDVAILGDERFDLVVLDEATQAPAPIALAPITRAPRVIMAGDPKQLPPTVIDPDAARDGLSKTLFERLAPLRPEATCMLTIQHRMNARLMDFPSHSMYDGRLTATDAVADRRLEDLGLPPDPLRPGPLLFIDTAGRGWEERRSQDDPSTSNPEQAQRAAAELRRLLGRGLSTAQVALITPYHAQARLLRDLLRAEINAGLDVGTVDSFQGREAEVILVDLVRSNERAEIGFLADTRRMNVAITRARSLLIILGDSATIGAHPYYAAFLASLEPHPGAWISAWDDDAPPWP
jgi:ATP-dependent RNA/DNA helicase IGHMBP2